MNPNRPGGVSLSENLMAVQAPGGMSIQCTTMRPRLGRERWTLERERHSHSYFLDPVRSAKVEHSTVRAAALSVSRVLPVAGCGGGPCRAIHPFTTTSRYLFEVNPLCR